MHENMKFKEKFKLKEELAKLRRNRIMDYEQTVKESYAPKIDEEKRKEVEVRQEVLKNKRLGRKSNGKS